MPADSELFAIEEVAAEWMIQRDRGMTFAQERDLARWLGADPRHAAAFNALAETWQLISAMPSSRDAGTARAAKRRGVRVWLSFGLAAAAAIALASVGSWQPSYPTRVDASSSFALSAATEVGVLRKVALPDGSVIQLNAETAVDVQFRAAERRVKLLRGEAHFTVAKNAGRPFIVNAAGVDVRVVGTVFNVRLRSEAVDVLVTEGRVRIAAPEGAEQNAVDGTSEIAGEARSRSYGFRSPLSEITAGQKVSIALGAAAIAATPVSPVDVSALEIKQALAWQARRLDFEAAPLADIVAELNRYNRHKLVIADPRLNAQRFGGSFPAGDYETFVRMLEANFGVVAERKTNRTLLRLKTP